MTTDNVQTPTLQRIKAPLGVTIQQKNTNPHAGDRLLVPAQAAKRLGVSRTKIYRLILGFNGEPAVLPAHKLGQDTDNGRKHWHIWESDLLKLIEKFDANNVKNNDNKEGNE
jgi:hypothetical protein